MLVISFVVTSKSQRTFIPWSTLKMTLYSRRRRISTATLTISPSQSTATAPIVALPAPAAVVYRRKSAVGCSRFRRQACPTSPLSFLSTSTVLVPVIRCSSIRPPNTGAITMTRRGRHGPNARRRWTRIEIASATCTFRRTNFYGMRFSSGKRTRSGPGRRFCPLFRRILRRWRGFMGIINLAILLEFNLPYNGLRWEFSYDTQTYFIWFISNLIKWFDRSIDWWMDWSIVWLIVWLIDWLFVRLIDGDWVIDWLIDWLCIGLVLVGWSIGIDVWSIFSLFATYLSLIIFTLCR